MSKWTYRDKHWWRTFEAAPIDVQLAMQVAMKARDDLKTLKKAGADPGMLDYLRVRIERAEAREAELLTEWGGPPARRPAGREGRSWKVEGIQEWARQQRGEPTDLGPAT